MCQREEEYPRTLIVSANALSTQRNNGKMVASFFKEYPPHALAQLYIWPEYPNCSACSSYYRITDVEMLRSWYGKTPGKIVTSMPAQGDPQMPGIFKKNIKNSSFLRLIRDIVWCRQSWKTEGFLQWVDSFSPEIIFFLGNNSPALYRIAEFLSARFGAPVIVYIADDYFLPRISLSLFFHMRRRWLAHSMRCLLQQEHTALLTVNQYMSAAYKKLFGKESQPIYHVVPLRRIKEKDWEQKGPLLVSYIGNLGENRTRTLRHFCALLSNYPNRDAFRFQIFTQETFSDREKEKWTLPPYVTHCGTLTPGEVLEQFEKSDVLLHMESFRYKSRKYALLSLSTKIMEYMSAERPILSIGPPEIGSTRFLKETENVVIDKMSPDHVYQALDRLLNKDFRREVSRKNLERTREILEQSHSDSLVLEVSKRLLAGEENI